MPEIFNRIERKKVRVPPDVLELLKAPSRTASRYKCVPEGMRLFDYTRGYVNIEFQEKLTDEDTWVDCNITCLLFA